MKKKLFAVDTGSGITGYCANTGGMWRRYNRTYSDPRTYSRAFDDTTFTGRNR